MGEEEKNNKRVVLSHEILETREGKRGKKEKEEEKRRGYAFWNVLGMPFWGQSLDGDE